MTLRTQFVDQMKASMKAGDSARTSSLRMIMAKLKDADIASRPKGVDQISDEEIASMLRGNGVTIMTRLHIDGVAFQDGATRLAPFFNVATVEDRVARS